MGNLLGACVLILILAAVGGVPALLIWGGTRFGRTECGRKYGEAVFLALLALMLIVGALLYVYHDYRYQEAQSNMRAALIRCGEILKNGQREWLAQRLAVFAESPEMDLAPVPFSVAFLRAVAPDREAPAWRFEARLESYVVGAVYVVLIGIWGMIVEGKAKPDTRRGYLVVLIVLTMFFMFGGLFSFFFETQAAGDHFRRDVRRLAEEVARPEIAPELLPLLERPEEDGFGYLWKLPKRDKPVYVHKPRKVEK